MPIILLCEVFVQSSDSRTSESSNPHPPFEAPQTRVLSNKLPQTLMLLCFMLEVKVQNLLKQTNFSFVLAEIRLLHFGSDVKRMRNKGGKDTRRRSANVFPQWTYLFIFLASRYLFHQLSSPRPDVDDIGHEHCLSPKHSGIPDKKGAVILHKLKGRLKAFSVFLLPKHEVIARGQKQGPSEGAGNNSKSFSIFISNLIIASELSSSNAAKQKREGDGSPDDPIAKGLIGQ